MSIGILSSTEYNSHMADHFRAGFVAGGRPFPALDTSQVAVGYDPTALATAIGALNGMGAVTLIVTVGGFVTCHAAILKSSKRFISLVGGPPEVSPPFGNFVGCCSMETYAADLARLQWLSNPANAGHFPGGAAFSLNSIGLLYNPNSKMAVSQVSHWSGAQGGQVVAAVNACPVNAPPNPTVGNFNADFALFGPGIRAIVISADPIFHANKSNLINAANNAATTANRYICYPLRSYRNRNAAVANQPVSGRSVLIGADSAITPAISVKNAYYQMGVMAAIAYNGSSPSSPVEKLQLAPPLPL